MRKVEPAARVKVGYVPDSLRRARQHDRRVCAGWWLLHAALWVAVALLATAKM